MPLACACCQPACHFCQNALNKLAKYLAEDCELICQWLPDYLDFIEFFNTGNLVLANWLMKAEHPIMHDYLTTATTLPPLANTVYEINQKLKKYKVNCQESSERLLLHFGIVASFFAGGSFVVWLTTTILIQRHFVNGVNVEPVKWIANLSLFLTAIISYAANKIVVVGVRNIAKKYSQEQATINLDSDTSSLDEIVSPREQNRILRQKFHALMSVAREQEAKLSAIQEDISFFLKNPDINYTSFKKKYRPKTLTKKSSTLDLGTTDIIFDSARIEAKEAEEKESSGKIVEITAPTPTTLPVKKRIQL